jgi:hypothetical protein
MGAGKRQSPVEETITEALERGAREADPVEVAEADSRLDELEAKTQRIEELLGKVDVPPVSAQPVAAPRAAAAPAGLGGVAMRTAVPVAVRGRIVQLRVRGVAAEVTAELAPGVSPEVVSLAAKNGDAVVVECVEGEAPLVVGVLQTRVPRELVLKAEKIQIEGDEELLLRSGRGALRIRRDGDVELVGSRISAMSRGLFRLVGRVLRLN